MPAPSVTIIVPAWNEADSIEDCLTSLATQDYEGRISIIVTDGGSTDGTQTRVEHLAGTLPAPVRLMDNPARSQSEGFNAAAGAADGEILVRADAHTWYAPDYVRTSVACLLESGAVAVGGPMRPDGVNRFGRAVAAAMASPLAVGPGKAHHAIRRTEADTVYLGTFRRSEFLAAGGYRTFPSAVAEDPDLYYRWRKAGRTVVLDPDIRSLYRPRSSPTALFRQYFKYGRGKAEMLYANREFPSWRPLAPLLLVVGLAASLILLPWTRWPLLLTSAAWLVGLLAVGLPGGRQIFTVIAATAIMHTGYGGGLLSGLLRGPGAVRQFR